MQQIQFATRVEKNKQTKKQNMETKEKEHT